MNGSNSDIHSTDTYVLWALYASTHTHTVTEFIRILHFRSLIHNVLYIYCILYMAWVQCWVLLYFIVQIRPHISNIALCNIVKSSVPIMLTKRIIVHSKYISKIALIDAIEFYLISGVLLLFMKCFHLFELDTHVELI